MRDIKKARWIRPRNDYGEVCPMFKREFDADKEIKSAMEGDTEQDTLK